MEVLPCSRVAHIERTKKPYNNDIDYYAKRNALRAAEVWMDDFKSHVYMAWNIPMTVRPVLVGWTDTGKLVDLREGILGYWATSRQPPLHGSSYKKGFLLIAMAQP